MLRLTGIATALIWGASLAGLPGSAHAQAFKDTYNFLGGRHGSSPVASVSSFGGKLYGTTTNGGTGTCRGHCGTVFSLDPKTGREKILYSFQGGSDGSYPRSGLIPVGGVLYGTTYSGGAPDQGTIFSLDPKTRVEKVVYAFQSGADGSAPNSNLLNVNGTLFGEATRGGNGAGVIFSFDPSTGVERIVYAFQSKNDGVQPYGGLISVNGLLYGTTTFLSPNSAGSVFSVDPTTGAENILYAFSKPEKEGATPMGGVTKVGNKLYGTTSNFGSGGVGTIFSLDLNGNNEKTVYAFQGYNDAAIPFAGLIDVEGTLYTKSLRS